MILVYCVPVCPTTPAPTLKILSADQAGIDIDVAQRFGAEPFEIKVEA